MRKIVIALLTTVALAACSSPSDRWQPTEVRRLNEVVFVNYDHTVRFDPGGRRGGGGRWRRRSVADWTRSS